MRTRAGGKRNRQFLVDIGLAGDDGLNGDVGMQFLITVNQFTNIGRKRPVFV